LAAVFAAVLTGALAAVVELGVFAAGVGLSAVFTAGFAASLAAGLLVVKGFLAGGAALAGVTGLAATLVAAVVLRGAGAFEVEVLAGAAFTPALEGAIGLAGDLTATGALAAELDFETGTVAFCGGLEADGLEAEGFDAMGLEATFKVDI
jgi:hypothetical protein